jgi:AcrR family transcriptional regulator
VARPVNEQRREDLLDATVAYVIKQGIGQLSWRQAAADLDVSPTTLVHRFGSKEQMIQAVLARLRERTFVDVGARTGTERSLATAARASWERAADPERWAETRLFFEVYGHALQDPQTFADFLEHVVADWKADLIDAQGRRADPATAEREATLVVATIRGLLLDLLTTGDRQRLDAAAEAFLTNLVATASGGSR